jgi:hypothetical protein
MEDVWTILTDYNNLAVHVPNLVKSQLIYNPSNPKGIRLFQEGAQKIVGFDFRASLIMDMTEESNDENSSSRQKFIRFKLVESGMFSAFEGSWILKYHSRNRRYDPVTGQTSYTYNTLLTYTVLVRPKGIVPVMALEWRIREDVPTNLKAVKIAAEKYSKTKSASTLSNSRAPPSSVSTSWGADETLGMYISKSSLITSETNSQSFPTQQKSDNYNNEGIINRMFQNILISGKVGRRNSSKTESKDDLSVA